MPVAVIMRHGLWLLRPDGLIRGLRRRVIGDVVLVVRSRVREVLAIGEQLVERGELRVGQRTAGLALPDEVFTDVLDLAIAIHGERVDRARAVTRTALDARQEHVLVDRGWRRSRLRRRRRGWGRD